MGAHDPSAAEGASWAVEVALAEGEAFEDLFGAGFDLPAIVFCEGGEGLVVGFGIVGFGGKEAVCFREGWGDGAGEVEDGFFADGSAFLGKEAVGGPFFPADLSRVWGILFEDKREEGRFAGSIGSDQAEAIAPVDLEGDVFEEDAASKGLRELGEGQHGWWRKVKGRVNQVPVMLRQLLEHGFHFLEFWQEG